ncbi:MAG: hypothetical protein KAT68_18835 [Bacteroidales bacterium]|nr:hypothetical protein [Bacteroidales bacterium]
MNSFINTLFDNNNIDEHDGRPLWKYNLSDKEYNELKRRLSNITVQDFDPRDITLYYAEWWKNEYNGGFPTKRDIYELIEECKLSHDDFYRFAKKGAVLLGIKWIQRENRLYFRTLLMQGGLPINHLLNNSGFYTNFLKKVLEINPSTIEEFAYDEEIIKYLPYSSRNEAVYDSCLQIVQAIWNGNEEYLEIFESKSTATTSFKKISDELKNHKKEVEKIAKKRTKFRAHWILNKTEHRNEIKLKFNFPEIIESSDFADLTQINEIDLQPEYNLIIEDILVCKFRRNIKGNYKVFWFNNSIMFWNGDETKPEISLSTTNGNRYNFPILMIDSPKISEPTLWAKNSENEYVLNQGKNCQTENAIVLFDNTWTIGKILYIKELKIFDKSLNWIEFKGDLKLSKDEATIVFKTNTTSFDWFIKDDKPKWVVKSNIPIVTKTPQIVAYRKNGERIKGAKLFWRLSGEIIWQKWNSITLPCGCIEFKIYAIGCEEVDYLYNIGNLYLDFISENQNFDEAKILLEENNNLSFQIKRSELYEYEQITDGVKLKLKNFRKGIKSVPAIINKPNQIRSLHLEIVPPFYGAKVLAPDGNILQNETVLLLGNFIGYRIITQFQKNHYYIKLYNTQKPHISIVKILKSSIVPLREYEELATRLFRLTDTMDENSSVSIELFNTNGELLNNFLIKSYNRILTYGYESENTIIKIDESETDIDLFAIPLDCSAFNINLIPLIKENDCFTIPESVILDKYIIFSGLNNNNNTNLLPCFITTNQNNTSTDISDRKQRIKNHIDHLKTQSAKDNSWKRVIKYYKICVNNEIPFSTFDIFRAATSTRELATKLFCFLSVYNESENFTDKICKDIEDDLGYSFHWISTNYWNNAVDWIKESFELSEKSEEEKLLREMIFSLINNSEPIDWFEKIADFILSNRTFFFNRFVLNEEIRILRQSLGEKVLNELPIICPKIPEEYKPILPVTYDTRLVKILLKAPLAVALLITGKNESIWNDNEQTETIRRNIQYCQWIAPDWYGKAILYCLNQLQNRQNYSR